jgi:hypothetical protein
MAPDDELRLTHARLQDIVDHVRLLAADADTQDSWLHHCGWTRQEPYVHVKDHAPCAPIAELVNSFDDMWPAWRQIVASALSPLGEAALERLAARLRQLDADAFRDAIETLDGDQWADVRRAASETLTRLVPA